MALIKKRNNFASMKTSHLLFVVVTVISLGFCSCEEQNTIVDQNIELNLDSLLMEHPDSISLLLKRGNELFGNYMYTEALSDAAHAFRLDTNRMESKLLYAECLSNIPNRTVEQVALAQKHYIDVNKKMPKNTKALVGLAATYSFQQDFKSSFQYVNEALRIDSRCRDAYVLKGTNYITLGNMDKAKSSYITAIQQDPDFFQAYYRLGQIYQAEKDPLCIEYFASALDLKPDLREVKYQLAYSNDVVGEYETAKELYREMASDTVDYYVARGLFHQGFIKQFHEQEVDSAMYFYRSALQTDPTYVESWHNLGLCYVQQNNRSKALQAFAKALKYDPDFELSRVEAEKLR